MTRARERTVDVLPAYFVVALALNQIGRTK